MMLHANKSAYTSWKNEGGRIFVHCIKADGVEPDVVTMNTMLKFCQSLGDAQQVVTSFKADGVEPNVVTMNTMLKFCQSLGDAQQVVTSFKADGVEPNVVTMTTIYTMIAKESLCSGKQVSHAVQEWVKSISYTKKKRVEDVEAKLVRSLYNCLAGHTHGAMCTIQNLIQSGASLTADDIFHLTLVVVSFFPEQHPLRQVTCATLNATGMSDVVNRANQNAGKFDFLFSQVEKSLTRELDFVFGGGSIWDDRLRFGVNSVARRGVLR